MEKNKKYLVADFPEDKIANDKIGMADYAKKLTDSIVNYNDEKSLSININGIWGSGKTTFINFIKECMYKRRDISIIKTSSIDFSLNNPNIYLIISILGWIVDIALKLVVIYGILKTPNSSIYYLLLKPILLGFILIFPIKKILSLLFKPYYIILKWLYKLKSKIIILWNSIEISIYTKAIKTKKNSYIIMDFSPWSYENIDSLISNFIDILKRECMFATCNLSKTLAEYKDIIKNKYLSISMLLQLLKELDSDVDNDLNTLKNDINNTLVKLNLKIVIFIDDIDRLTKNELINMCKLLKSIANFKNTIYVLPFDRAKVSEVLNTECADGSDYLDKITNFNVDLRKAGTESLKDFLLDNLENIAKENNSKITVKSDKENIELQNRLLDNFKINYSQNYEILFRGLFQTRRQIKRYLNHINFLYAPDETNIYDFLNITAIQYFYPKIYDLVYQNKNLLCKEYPLYYVVDNIKVKVGMLINDISNYISPSKKQSSNIVINLFDDKISPDDIILKLKCYFETIRIILQEQDSIYSEKIQFVKENIIKHLEYILLLLKNKENDTVKTELSKLREHIDRETRNIKDVFKDFYQIEKDRTRFLEFIEECQLGEDKREAFIRFMINLFPNLNILFDNKYKLFNTNLYLFRLKEDSLRDRRICNYKIFNNYFEYNQYPITLKKIKNIFNIRKDNLDKESYLSVYQKLLDIYQNNYIEFVNTIEDGLLYETSSFFGAGCSDFKIPFKEYTKALIMAYSLKEHSYTDYEKEYKPHPSHKRIIKDGIIRMIQYLNKPSVGKQMFFESINELSFNNDTVQNIKEIDYLFSFLSDVLCSENECNKYRILFDIKKEELDSVIDKAITRLKKIIPTNDIIDKYKELPDFLYRNASTLKDDFLCDVLIDIGKLKNSNMDFIKRYPEKNSEITNKYFVTDEGEYVNVYRLLSYWKRRRK